MATKTIPEYANAGGIDPVQDYFLLYQNSTDTYRRINRDTVLGSTGSPVDTSSIQTLSNKTLGSTNTITALDSNFTLQDNATPSKQAQFQLSGISSATTRTFTLPDANTTLVGTGATQTLTNKTLTSPTITGGSITGSSVVVDSIVGNSDADSGTVFGVSILNGIIASAALNNTVNTAALQNDAVTPEKMDFGALDAINANSGTTTSTTYTSSLTTLGTLPAVTVTVPTSGSVLVLVTAGLHNSTAEIRTSLSYSLSGTNTLTAANNTTAGRAVNGRTTTAVSATWSSGWLHTGLNSGSTTFQLEAQVQANTGTVSTPAIAVIPIGD